MAFSEHTAKFVLRGEDRTKAAVASARREFRALKDTVFSLKGALAGGLLGVGIAEGVRHLVDANVDFQRIHFTLEAALGSSEAANKEFGFLAHTADELGTNLREGAKGFSLLAASAQATHIPIRTIESLYAGLSKQFTILHSSTSQQNRALLALDEIMSMGVAHSRQLRRQLAMALPGSGMLPKLMERLGMDPQQFEKALKSDKLTAQLIVPMLAAIFNNVNPTALGDATKSLNSDLNRLHNTIFLMENNASQYGFLSGIEDAIVNLTNTLKDPAVQRGLGELAKQVGDMLSMAARFGAAAASGIDRFALALDNLSSTDVTFKGGSTIGAAFKNVEARIEKRAAYMGQRDIAPKYVKDLLAGKPLKDYMINDLAFKKQAYGDYAKLRRDLQTRARLGRLMTKYGAGASASNPSGDVSGFNLWSDTANLAKSISQSIGGSSQATTDAIQKILDALQKEAATYGMTAEQIKLYELRHLKASPTAMKAARGSLAIIKAKQEAKKEAKAHTEALRKEKTSLDELTRSLDAEIDPLRKYRMEQQKLDIALSEGLINKADYLRYSAQVRADMAKTDAKVKHSGSVINQFSVQAAHNFQDILGGAIENVFKGKGNLFQSFADSFLSMSEQVIAQILALKAATALFGKDFASGKSDSIGGLIGQLIGSFASTGAGKGHSGAVIGSSGMRRMTVPTLAFASAPRYHGGGVLGLRPNEFPFVGLKGEEVLSRGDPRNRANGGGRPNVTVNQYLPPQHSGFSEPSDAQVARSAGRGVSRAMQRSGG